MTTAAERLESVIAITLKDLRLPEKLQSSADIPFATVAKEATSVLRQNKDYAARCEKIAKRYGCTFFEQSNGDFIFAKLEQSPARVAAKRTVAKQRLELRPTVSAPSSWYPQRPPKDEWERVRKIVLDRDNHTCRFCGHQALKWMNIHHVGDHSCHDPDTLITTCVACHAVLHAGRNLALGIIEFWNSEITQLNIVRRTRDGIKRGKSLADINKELPLRPAGSTDHVKSVLDKIGDQETISLPKPLCTVFVNFKRWQVE